MFAGTIISGFYTAVEVMPYKFLGTATAAATPTVVASGAATTNGPRVCGSVFWRALLEASTALLKASCSLVKYQAPLQAAKKASGHKKVNPATYWWHWPASSEEAAMPSRVPQY